jgi:ribosomal protein L11 methyltransferase
VRAFVVVVPASEAELASDVLWQLGVRAIEERGVDPVELWTSVGDDDESIRRAADRMGERWSSRVETTDDAAAETWREFAAPMWVDDGLVVTPAWQHHDFSDDVVVVPIEPEGAFGLGDHPTTLLSLRAIRPLIRPSCSLLDVGCGTGVLAVVAAVLGATRVRAVDIASAAVEATAGNACRNAVARCIEVDTAPAALLQGEYDVVVANILAPSLVELADDLRRLTAADGRLVVSGILAERHDHVLAALAPMIVEQTAVLDGWAVVTLRHH